MVQKYTQDIYQGFLSLNGRKVYIFIYIYINIYIYSHEAEAELGKAQIPVLHI